MLSCSDFLFNDAPIVDEVKLGQSFDALAGDVEIKLELETMTTLQDDHKWSAPPKRSRDLTKMAISKNPPQSSSTGSS